MTREDLKDLLRQPELKGVTKLTLALGSEAYWSLSHEYINAGLDRNIHRGWFRLQVVAPPSLDEAFWRGASGDGPCYRAVDITFVLVPDKVEVQRLP